MICLMARMALRWAGVRLCHWWFGMARIGERRSSWDWIEFPLWAGVDLGVGVNSMAVARSEDFLLPES